MKKYLCRLAVCALGLVAGTAAANAYPIIYTISGLESGRVVNGINTTNFTNVLVTVTGYGDTADFGSGPYGSDSISLSGGTIFVQGFGTGTITSALGLFVNQSLGVAGFITASDALDMSASFFDTYDGISAAGPITGKNAEPFSGQQFVSTIGRVQIRDLTPSSSQTLTFTAPEPATIALLIPAAAAVSLLRRRRNA